MRLAPVVFTAAVALAAGSAYAQPQPAPAPRAQGPQWQRPDPAQMAERHAQRLRDALQLRPDQEPALRALTAAMQPSAQDMQRMRQDRAEDRNLTTPQRLDRMEARMAERQARFRQHADAIRRFYAQLTPAQQKAFDAMPMMGSDMHDGSGMRGGPGMMHRGPGAPGPGKAPTPGR